MKEISPSEKAKTEFLAWRVYKELIDMLYYVGFLVGSNSDSEINNNAEPEIPQKIGEIEEFPKLLSPQESKKIVEKMFRKIMESTEKLNKQNYNKKNKEEDPPDESVI